MSKILTYVLINALLILCVYFHYETKLAKATLPMDARMVHYNSVMERNNDRFNKLVERWYEIDRRLGDIKDYTEGIACRN